jgi:hypothetical protein
LATKSSLTKDEINTFQAWNKPLTNETYFVPEKGTINQIASNNGGITMKNKDLQTSIYQYYTAIDRNEKNDEVSVQLYQHNYISYFITRAVYIKQPSIFYPAVGQELPLFDIIEVKKDQDYFFAFGAKAEGVTSQMAVYTRFKKEGEAILALIEDQLASQ